MIARNSHDSKKLLKKLFEVTDEKKSKKKSNVYLFVLLSVGIVLMLVSNLMTSSEENESTSSFQTESDRQTEEEVFGNNPSTPSSMVEYEEHYENELRDILTDVIGISSVSVKINLASTEKKIFENNRTTDNQVTEETDRDGGKRVIENHSTDEEVIIINDGNKEKPVVIGVEKPEVTGVIVVAEGAENVQIKQQIIEAVTRFLDVPSHRVSVLAKKIKEE